MKPDSWRIAGITFSLLAMMLLCNNFLTRVNPPSCEPEPSGNTLQDRYKALAKEHSSFVSYLSAIDEIPVVDEETIEARTVDFWLKHR